jgi:hypothetical protein
LAICALAFRRAKDADLNQAVAVVALVPILQIVVVLCLCAAPSQEAADHPRLAEAQDRPRPTEALAPSAMAEQSTAPQFMRAALVGVVAGALLTVLAVAIGTLIFGTYGFGLFLLTPFVIGAITAYLANKDRDIGAFDTSLLVALSIGLGSVALILVALEGAICIIMAAPIGLVFALLGGALGRAIALSARRPARETLSCLALVPLVFATEFVLPATTRFDTVQTIEVHAPSEIVWQSILSTDPVEGPLALPSRLGVAYPIRGEIIGEGVGAVRRGEFSTGTAIEHISEWEPNRRLAFVVVDDIPAMRELSPYEHVHAPHAVGYFRTLYTSLELVRRPNGYTEIIERTSHELRLDPVLYWLPMARWVVHENNGRVLAHIRRHAEQRMQAGR